MQSYERGILPRLEAKVTLIVTQLCLWMAYIGGLLLVGIALMTFASILGNSASKIGSLLDSASWFTALGQLLLNSGLGPVPGETELTEQLIAVSICLFLPWCQARRGHVTVDLFVEKMAFAPKQFLTLLGDIAMCVVAVIIAWKMWGGLGDMREYGETTFILAIPIWWGYAAGMFGAVLFACVSFTTVWRCLNSLMSGSVIVDGESN